MDTSHCDRLPSPSGPRWFAATALAVLVAGLVAAIYLDFVQPYQPTSPTPVPIDDLKLYRAIAQDVRAGAGYYEATGRRLRAAAYPVSSVVRWRLPTLTWLAALTGERTFQVLLIALWAVAIALTLAAAWRETTLLGWIILTAGLAGLWWWTFDGISQYTHELWASGLVLLSAGLFAIGRRWPALAVAIAALAIREHAILYCLAAGGVALSHKRRLEAAAWAAGIAAFLVFFWWHSRQVLGQLIPEEMAGSAGVRPWIRFGGLAFVLQTVRMNAILFYLPGWVAYLYLAAALYGFAHISGELGRLLMVAVVLYLAAFAVVGQEFNGYWGLLYVPLLPLGLAQACATAKQLMTPARWRRTI